jgi:hypothetical protein
MMIRHAPTLLQHEIGSTRTWVMHHYPPACPNRAPCQTLCGTHNPPTSANNKKDHMLCKHTLPRTLDSMRTTTLQPAQTVHLARRFVAHTTPRPQQTTRKITCYANTLYQGPWTACVLPAALHLLVVMITTGSQSHPQGSSMHRPKNPHRLDLPPWAQVPSAIPGRIQNSDHTLLVPQTHTLCSRLPHARTPTSSLTTWPVVPHMRCQTAQLACPGQGLLHWSIVMVFSS